MRDLKKFSESRPDIRFVFIGLVFISILAWFVHHVTPAGLPVIIIFLTLIFGIIFPLAYYLLNNVRRGFLCAAGVSVFLFLRYLNLREILYPALVAALLFTIDVYFRSFEKNNCD